MHTNRRVVTDDARSALLPDHLGFLNELEIALENLETGARLGVAVVTLDCVTSIDGLLGYHSGDAFIAHIAFMLQKALKDGDRVFRVGRNDLVCLLRRLPSDTHAILAAYKILRTLSTSLSIEGYYFDATPYVGISMSPESAGNADQIARQANIAVYESRQKKDRYVIYNSKLERRRREQFELQNDLHSAIANNELKVAFQPKINLHTEKLVGVEALIRWRHPDKGDINPTDFIRLAVSSGFISELTMRVLNLAFSNYDALRAAAGFLQMTINLSSRDLRETDFPSLVQSVLSTWNIPPASVMFELSEADMMDDESMYDETYAQLKELGVQLSVDDFGSGYSSLSRLRNLPVEELKIDMRFVRNMMAYSSDEWIVQSIIRLAHDLGLKVVAEGVEDMETLRKLQTLGCDMAQGYVISPPLPANDMARFLSEWKGLPTA